jgi:DNA-binding LytR/AlgR family response regulator
MTYRTLIIEDEAHAAAKLKRNISEVDPEIEIVDVVDCVDDAVNWLQTNEADLILLEIHLGDTLSFEIFDQVKINTPIIFTTAYDQYAIRAFKLNSLDYLLKPVRKEELAAALKKFREKGLDQQRIDMDQLIKAMRSDQEYQKRFMIYTGDKIRTIPVEEVAYFFAEGKYCYLVSLDNHEYLLDFTLDKLEKVINPDLFFRINRKFIISFDSIIEMHTYPKGRVKIDLKPHNKREAIVSIERSPDFKRWLNR